MTAATACRTCGTEPREGARFCDGCGAPVTGHDTHAEYKQVTVLFADVVHSMDIASAVGAERLREIMTELVTRTAAGAKGSAPSHVLSRLWWVGGGRCPPSRACWSAQSMARAQW